MKRPSITKAYINRQTLNSLEEKEKQLVEKRRIKIIESLEEKEKQLVGKGIIKIIESLEEKGIRLQEREIKSIDVMEVLKKERGRHRGEIPENFEALLLRYQTEKYFTLDSFAKNAVLKDGTTLKRSTLCNYIKQARIPKKEEKPKERTYQLTITTSSRE